MSGKEKERELIILSSMHIIILYNLYIEYLKYELAMFIHVFVKLFISIAAGFSIKRYIVYDNK